MVRIKHLYQTNVAFRNMVKNFGVWNMVKNIIVLILIDEKNKQVYFTWISSRKINVYSHYGLLDESSSNHALAYRKSVWSKEMFGENVENNHHLVSIVTATEH